MATIQVHPENPQVRLLQQAVEVLRSGGVIVYPTDSAYALGCELGNKHALDRLRHIKNITEKHHLTLVCRDLSELATYARVDNQAYRFIKAYTPGPYTFILKATREVPRSFQNPKRRDLGLRVPDNKITQALLEKYGAPIASTTLIMSNETEPLCDMQEIEERLTSQVDLIIDGGFCGIEATTVIDLITEPPAIVRQGKGEVF